MSDSITTTMGPTASVVDGVLQQVQKVEQKKTAEEMNELGKDAFLQLLVAQMENQDPLEPTSDTEWVSQLATYSQLEQMQNMNQALTNTQAFSLVGQQVIISKGDDDDGTVSGSVDYVTVKNGKAHLSVGGNLYPMDDLISVINYEYMVNNCIPKVEETAASFDKANPSDVSFKVDMGSDVGLATAVAIILNEEVISSSYVTLDKDGTVTIASAALQDLETGSYTPTIVFNDSFSTNSTGNFLLSIIDSNAQSTGTAGTESSLDTNTESNTNSDTTDSTS